MGYYLDILRVHHETSLTLASISDDTWDIEDMMSRYHQFLLIQLQLDAPPAWTSCTSIFPIFPRTSCRSKALQLARGDRYAISLTQKGSFGRENKLQTNENMVCTTEIRTWSLLVLVHWVSQPNSFRSTGLLLTGQKGWDVIESMRLGINCWRNHNFNKSVYHHNRKNAILIFWANR